MGMVFSSDVLPNDMREEYRDQNGEIEWVYEGCSFNISLTYTTGFTLLRQLGYVYEPDTYAGSIPAAKLLLACLKRIEDPTLEDNRGIETTYSRGEGGCQMVSFGRRPGYFHELTYRLRDLCSAALKLDPSAVISFG